MFPEKQEDTQQNNHIKKGSDKNEVKVSSSQWVFVFKN